MEDKEGKIDQISGRSVAANFAATAAAENICDVGCGESGNGGRSMYEETKLSEQAQKIEEALFAVPPRYDEADKIFAEHSITKEELAKIACDLMDKCLDEQYLYYWDSLEELVEDNLKELVEDNTVTSNIYKIMQYLFSKGYDPNVVVNDGCAMGVICFLDCPEGLAPRLMRLFMENGGDPNLEIEGVPLFVQIDSAVSFDKYMSRSFVYCWLVLMAYGGRLGEDEHLPLTMRDDLDVNVFKRFEDYSYYKIVPEKHVPGEHVYWKMLIYDTGTGESPKLAAFSSYYYIHYTVENMSELLLNDYPSVKRHDRKREDPQ